MENLIAAVENDRLYIYIQHVTLSTWKIKTFIQHGRSGMFYLDSIFKYKEMRPTNVIQCYRYANLIDVYNNAISIKKWIIQQLILNYKLKIK